MSKTITIIELLNKIAKGEEVPEYVRYFHRISKKFEIMLVCKENIIDKLNRGIFDLDYTVEILEDEETIDIDRIKELKDVVALSEEGYMTRGTFIDITSKINELIKAVKQLNKKIKEER